MLYEDIDAKQLFNWLSGENPPYLIDVRTPEEMAQASIDGAVPMPLTVLPLRTQDVPKDRDVVFYCRSGARSGQACMFMRQHGYKRLYNLRGGIISWVQHGYPVVPLVARAS
ncbi:rhodanese-like domain-containing protein [Thioflexithrix psekupsensis]|uniref:Sulfurtransferase n=1 Tax=Thioflexithrix psekupsensis TaxID=1570016 RepID=A0A251X4B1_9GAMM|nr:rhodanese-like domain-containing protein [Thioflexithrix psekupsensis]OUD12019.1 sulfurtransferase [Thioflexithrix psekupsensis]